MKYVYTGQDKRWRKATRRRVGQGRQTEARGGGAETAFDSTHGASQVSLGAGVGGAKGARGTGRQGEWLFAQQRTGCVWGAEQSGGGDRRQGVVQCVAREAGGQTRGAGGGVRVACRLVGSSSVLMVDNWSTINTLHSLKPGKLHQPLLYSECCGIIETYHRTAFGLAPQT